MNDTGKFDVWAIVELFGHQVIAGRVTDQTVGGETFVRVDVPVIDARPAFTKLFGKGAIYSITPTTEEIVRGFLHRNREEPIQPYLLAVPVQTSEPDWGELERQAREMEKADWDGMCEDEEDLPF